MCLSNNAPYCSFLALFLLHKFALFYELFLCILSKKSLFKALIRAQERPGRFAAFAHNDHTLQNILRIRPVKS